MLFYKEAKTACPGVFCYYKLYGLKFTVTKDNNNLKRAFLLVFGECKVEFRTKQIEWGMPESGYQNFKS